MISPSQRPLPTQYTTNTREGNTFPSAGLEPVIPAIKRLQTHAFERMATGMGRYEFYLKTTDQRNSARTST